MIEQKTGRGCVNRGPEQAGGALLFSLVEGGLREGFETLGRVDINGGSEKKKQRRIGISRTKR